LKLNQKVATLKKGGELSGRSKGKVVKKSPKGMAVRGLQDTHKGGKFGESLDEKNMGEELSLGEKRTKGVKMQKDRRKPAPSIRVRCRNDDGKKRQHLPNVKSKK